MDLANGMPSGDAMQSLYDRLSAVGFPRAYVKRVVLPYWWSDSQADDQAGYGRAIGYIHQHLGISLDQLWNPLASIEMPTHGLVFFKKSKKVKSEGLSSARCVAVAAIDIALAAMPDRVPPKFPDAAQIRNEILQSGSSYVDLPELVDRLWAAGIPVLHIDDFPATKMAGLVARRGGKIGIVLSTNHKFKARMAFDLAHEFGHILSGHLDTDECVIDLDIGNGGDQSDPRETQADQLATVLLTGNAEFHEVCDRDNGVEWALSVATKNRVSPGVIGQMYGHLVKDYTFSAMVCKATERRIDPIEIIRSKMLANISVEDLSPDDAEFLMRVACGGEMNALSVRH